jgi:aminocarboxymuconate-semialdehyde decarboxylase
MLFLALSRIESRPFVPPREESRMLIELHGHHMTKGMLDLDPHWGPSWTSGTLKIGDWYLGTTKLPDAMETSKEDLGDSIGDTVLARTSHEFRLQLMEKLGVDVLVISVPAHAFMYWADDFGVRFAKTTNDEFAKWTAEDPDHFMWWATLPMHRPKEAAAELERAVSMGAVGFMCGGANLGGYNLHDPDLDVVWEKTAELDVPVMIHGFNQSVTWGKDAMNDPFDTTSILGMCYDETRAFWHIVCGGVLDRFPSLKFYITHAGGFVPYHLNRFAQTNVTMAPDAVNRRPLLDYMSSFYFDPAVHDDDMRRAMVKIIGPDQLVYGTNFMGSDQIDGDITDNVGLSDDDREKIKSGNAIELLKLKDRIPQPA